MAQLWSGSGQTLVDGNGNPYPSWRLLTYETGTTTPKATYSDAALTAANTNPVVADANGRMGDVYLLAGRYKLVFQTSAGVTIDTLDPVDGTLQLIQSATAPAATYPLLRYHNTTDGNVYRRNSANTAWISEGPVDSIGNAATVTQQLTGTETAAFSTPDSVAGLWQRGSDLASATTLSLPATGGGVFNVTGTTTINGISTAQGGRCIKLKFNGSLTLTHATSFILPGGTNIVTSANDVAEFVNEAAADANGSNWRCFNYMFASGVPVAAPVTSSKSASYTVTDADRGALIRFAALSADVTLTLPAASGRAGFVVYVVNDDTNDTTGYGVTIDPNASETIDGLTTRKGYVGTRVTILCDGTGWRTVSGYYRYFSGDQTISISTNLTLAHGLGVRPRRIWCELKCTTADLNYSVGDILHVAIQEGNAAGQNGAIVYLDATNVNVRYCNNTWYIQNKTLASNGTITAASWRARFYAED